MAAISILQSLIKIFILIIPGIIFRKKELITNTQNNAINKIITHMTWPCLVIDAMQMKFSMDILYSCGNILCVTLSVLVILFLLSIPFAKLLCLDRFHRYLVLFMLLFGNTGFIGLPVLQALYGSEALFFAAIIELINDLLIFTVGILLIQSSAGFAKKIEFRQFLSPGLIGVLIGLALFLTDTQLPGLLAEPISMIGTATTPLTMFVIGYQLASYPIKELLKDLQIYAVSLMKLLLVPLITWLMTLGWSIDMPLISHILIVGLAMPVASVSVIFTQQYQGDVFFATKGVLLSTLLSLLTIPVIAVLLNNGL